MTNLAETLARSAAAHADRPAIRLDERLLLYRELDEASARVANWLLLSGITIGDRVGLMMPNVPEFPELYYGILRAGAIVVPINPQFKPREVEYYLTDSAAALALAWHGVADQAEQGAKNAGTDLVIIEPGELSAIDSGRRRSRTGDRAPRAVRHRRHPLHLRHNGSAKRCRTHP